MMVVSLVAHWSTGLISARTSIRSQRRIPILSMWSWATRTRVHLGTVIHLLFSQFINLLNGGLRRVQMFMCVMTYLCFLLTRPQEPHASVLGVRTVDLKLTLGKTVRLKNVQH